MTTNSPRTPAYSTPIAAGRCPKCKSGDVRRSRRTREDSQIHRLFFHAYRCRDCRTRFWRLNGLPFAVVAAVGLIIGAAIAIDWAMNDDLDDLDEPAAAETTKAEPNESAMSSPAFNPELFKLAEEGDARAQFSLGTAYLNGRGAPKDMVLALKWFNKAAQQGHADGQHALGSMYLAGRGVRQNFQIAFKWFDLAARQNHADAQYQVGVMYRSGNGVDIDKPKAYVWFNLAAAQGHAQAAIERDRLVSTMTSEQVAVGQRDAQAWRPSAAKP